jgi:hypothetical protein
MYFKNLDKLMKYVNQDGRLNMFYSTPSIYTEAKNAAALAQNLTFPTKQDDFFPYADDSHAFWSGYYTSRPALKRFIRDLSGEFQSLRLIQATSPSSAGTNTPGMVQFRKALAVSQHHDAVAGTSMQHVAFDYAARLAAGQAAAEEEAFASLLEQLTIPGGAAPPVTLQSCPLLNISICAPSQSISQSTGGNVIVLTNPLWRNRTELISLPLPGSTCPSASSVYVLNYELVAVPSQLRSLQLDDPSRQPESAACEIVFLAEMPPAASIVFFLMQNSSASASSKAFETESIRLEEEGDEDSLFEQTQLASSADVSAPETVSISNSFYTLTYSTSTGLLQSLAVAGGASQPLVQDFFYYSSFQDPTMQYGDHQNSGAYIFRPNATLTLMPVRDSPGENVTIVSVTNDGSVVQEIVQQFSSWLTQTTRLTAGEDSIEFIWTVGPVPIDDGVGKEIITRYSSSIASDTVWYTDSNGREMQKRTRFMRPTYKPIIREPVAGEYYPVNSIVSLNDLDQQMTILTDRSQGTSSLQDGAIEIMLHRRILLDDMRGVQEPLNETSFISPYPNPVRGGAPLVVKGAHRMVFTAANAAARVFRPLASRIYSRPFLSIAPLNGLTPAEWAGKFAVMTPGAGVSGIPPNVEVMSIQGVLGGGSTGGSSALVRVAHHFAVGEDPEFSQPASLDLAAVFCCGLTASGIVEMSLTANRPLAEMPARLQWNAGSEDGSAADDFFSRYAPLDGTTVQLAPMQIRTFNLTW